MTELGKQIKQSLSNLTSGMGGRLSGAQEDEIKRIKVLVDELDRNYEALRTAVLEKPQPAPQPQEVTYHFHDPGVPIISVRRVMMDEAAREAGLRLGSIE